MPADDNLAIGNGNEGSHVRRRWLVVAVLILALLIAGVWYWTARGGEASAQAGQPQSGPDPSGQNVEIRSTLHLETFVLNLADANERAYLRVGIDLGLSQELKHGESVPVAQLRDTILGVLAEARADDLLNTAGKARLKQNLLQALQRSAPQLGIAEVYFTEFLIQR